MIAFGPAEARPKKVVAGISGPTGAGKTYSALEIGTGLVGDPAQELFLIDTEFGRGAHYANAYAFQYGQLSPPFTPPRYQEAIEASIAAGSQCTIIDSLSHIWEGDGGLLDWHGDIALKMARGDEARAEQYNFPAWRQPKQALQQFVLYLQRCPIHLILCMRAKEKSKMVKTVAQDGRTRTEIVAAGLQPIIDTATPYEATFLAMLSPEEPGVPHWTHKALASYLQPIFANGQKQLSREHGRRLAQWCGTESPGGHRTSEAREQPAAGRPHNAGVAQPMTPVRRAILDVQAQYEATGAQQPTPAASTNKSQEARDRFMAALEKATTIGSAAELDAKLRKARPVLGELYSECAAAMQAKVSALTGNAPPQMPSAPDPLDDTEAVIADLESMGDERQGDLV